MHAEENWRIRWKRTQASRNLFTQNPDSFSLMLICPLLVTVFSSLMRTRLPGTAHTSTLKCDIGNCFRTGDPDQALKTVWQSGGDYWLPWGICVESLRTPLGAMGLFPRNYTGKQRWMECYFHSTSPSDPRDIIWEYFIKHFHYILEPLHLDSRHIDRTPTVSLYLSLIQVKARLVQSGSKSLKEQ